MSRDFETLYYEQQAAFTETNGMLHQENEGLRKKVEELTAAMADEKSSSKAVYERAHMLERQISELRSYAVKSREAMLVAFPILRRVRDCVDAIQHFEADAAMKMMEEAFQCDTASTAPHGATGTIAGTSSPATAGAASTSSTAPSGSHEICTHRYRILGGACAQCGDVTINGAGTPPRNEVVVADSSVPGKAASPLEPSARPSGATNECVHQVGRQPRASFDAFRWMGDLDAFEKWYGQRCPVDHGGQISVPCGRPEGAYLRVWCGSWIVRQSDGKCHTLRDDTMRYMLDEYYPGEYEALTCHAINSHPSDEGHQP